MYALSIGNSINPYNTQSMQFALQMPQNVLEKICLDIILSDRDVAYLTLSLTCQGLSDVVSSGEFPKAGPLCLDGQ